MGKRRKWIPILFGFDAAGTQPKTNPSHNHRLAHYQKAMNSNFCCPQGIALILFAFLWFDVPAAVQAAADLPSCIRAKCTHCRVPFIAEMCPGACAVCGPSSKHFVTTAQQPSQVPDARAFGQAQIKVPFAQQVPLPGGARGVEAVLVPNNVGGGGGQQQRQQQVIYRGVNNNNNNGPQNQQQPYRNQYGTDFGAAAAGAEHHQQPLPFNQNQQGGQFPAQNQNQGQFVPQPQTTSFGGFYNNQQEQFYPQGGFGPVPPPPPPQPIQSTDVGAGGRFGNPFQPFLQQSFNSAQQFQPQQQQPATNGLSFTPPPVTFSAPPINGAGGDGGSGTGSAAPAQFAAPIQPQQQQYFGQYNLQPQQQQQQNNNNNFNGQINPNNNNNQQDGQFAQPQTAVLHAVPNVADPLQRPRQLYPASQEPSDKHLQNLVEPPNNYLLDKGALVDEGKKPFSASGFIHGENGQTCPKQPNWEPCVPKEIANQRFRNCCTRLGDGCSQLCSYDQNLSTIQLAVLTGRCPVSRVAEMMLCASGNEDATACCQAFGVFEAGYEHCRPYCNPSGGLPNDGMLAEKYRCLQKLAQIQKCFYLTQRP
uniref:Domain of unknown function DB domain-containing protein n=1 Tax=Globodera rostochiensis TaxID=31243 RepID=A0A914H7J0_GLORO